MMPKHFSPIVVPRDGFRNNTDVDAQTPQKRPRGRDTKAVVLFSSVS
jgi:hypothetical protein